jgi:hypothetical protein
MPSPFPGMNPYLEGRRWSSFHHLYITEITHQLSLLLSAKYIALPQERFVTWTPEVDEGLAIMTAPAAGSAVPDVSVAEFDPRQPSTQGTAAGAPTLEIATVMPEKVPQSSVEIRNADNNALVTAIELLSPANKRGRGRKEYLRKRSKYLLSPAHLVEIDLLGAGHRPPMVGRLPSVRYFVFVSRAWKRPVCEVYPIPLTSRLPVVDIPLIGRAERVSLNLQAGLDHVYDSYLSRVVSYAGQPDAPLSPSEQEWVDGVVANLQR